MRPYGVLDAWVGMPEHGHGWIGIVETDTPRWGEMDEMVETARRGVSTKTTAGRLQPGSLGAMIGQFKSVCTKRISAAGYRDFAWQSRFYDHVA